MTDNEVSKVTASDVAHMKWWGWGRPEVSFTHNDKPQLRGFIQKNLDLDIALPGQPPLDIDDIKIAESVLPAALRKQLTAIVGAENVRDDTMERVTHGYGKSLRDIVRLRRGDVGRAPDVVVYPAGEAEVEAVLKAALDADAVLIPFGGGSNIAGSLEPERSETRPVISLDMGRMNRLLDIDAPSNLARIEAGALGPDLERQLNNRGWTIGHFPDSFNHSTLGGWIATRSSGMQSDKYGDIADLTRGLRVVSPKGIVAIRPVPSTSTGPSVREMILGSEGRLGIITEATVHVHRIPEKREIQAYLFPTFPQGVRAMNAIAASDAAPSITRVSDSNETQFSFATKKESSRVDQMKSDAMKMFLEKRKNFDVSKMCLSFIGYEGSPENVKRQKKLVGDIVSSFGGVGIGSSPGQLYDQKKFDTPYIRDFLLDRGAFADVSETSTSWSQLVPLYEGVVKRANAAFDELGTKGWIMCHLSHSYHSGACLYFTFAFKPVEGRDELEQYDIVKSAIQQGFVDLDGTLSHHHAVGVEHKQWIEQDISPAGAAIVRSLLESVDEKRNLNPGKIVD
jgi:alkyldihydroxyacetonephosphate synthase